MSTKSSIFYGEDDQGHCVHIYWELAEREIKPRFGAPVYIEIEFETKSAAIRLPKEIAEKVVRALGCSNSTEVL